MKIFGQKGMNLSQRGQMRKPFNYRRFPVIEILYSSLDLIEPKSRRILKRKMAIQALLGVLDFVGVALIGLLGAVAVSGLESSNQDGAATRIIGALGMSGFSFQAQVGLLGVAACLFLLLRTFLSILVTHRALKFLAGESSRLGEKLMRDCLERGLVFLESKERSHLLFTFTDAVNHLIIGVIGASIILASDISVLIIMSLGLLLFSPSLAISALVFFAIVALILNANLSRKSRKFGEEGTRLRININNNTLDMLNIFRELMTIGKINSLLDWIQQDRVKLAKNTSDLSFLPNVSKYVLESSVVLGGLLLGGQQFLAHDAIHAVTTLSVFIAAGSRIVPALLRVQQNLLSITTNGSAGKAALALFSRESSHTIENGKFRFSENALEIQPIVTISEINFSYPGNRKFSLHNISLEIKKYELTAFVGPSGSGKSTLVDLILGLLEPTSGTIEISGTELSKLKCNWPRSISYVPQRVHLVQGDIYSNVALGVEPAEIDFQMVQQSLQKVGLAELLEGDPNDKSRSKKLNLSGGQLQRIGLARALYTKPNLVVLDEATSALDAQTENEITKVLDDLRSEITLIIVAHRLSTVMKADRVCYFEDGEVRAIGKFTDVRALIPNFDQQAKLMGL
jgi:ABC-type multidrug transport system fused ATPase/permease subunit